MSENAADVRNSLEALMHGVSEAFLVSAFAIGAAMATTFIEKLLITALYRKVEEITFELDSMFTSGAGEEYLARLVKASEDSADQSKILKDVLVTDLERILANLTEQQIQAQVRGHQELGNRLVETLSAGIKDPLTHIADAMKGTKEGNLEAVTKLLTDVLTGFSQRLQELFGGQITGINQLQQQTIEALQSAVEKMGQMVANVEAAGTRTSDTMGQKLADAIGSMETRQQVMNERMTEFVEQIRHLVRDSQSETSERLQKTLEEIGEAARLQLGALKEQFDTTSSAHKERQSQIADQTVELLAKLGSHVDSVVGTLRSQSEEAAGAQIERERRLTVQTDETLGKFAALGEGLLAELRAVTLEVRSTVEAMRALTSDTVSRMNSGAETMFLAASEFSTAGQGVAGVLQQATNVSGKLVEVTGSLSASSTALQGVVADYTTTRETLATMLADLRGTVENAKREAALTADVLARIESASMKFGQAQKDAEEYLDQISDVLRRAQGEFAESITKVLGDSYRVFYERLSGATGLLREAIEELGSAIEPTMRRA